jgi:hypothetical protein
MNSGLKGPHTYAQPFLTSNGTWPTSLYGTSARGITAKGVLPFRASLRSLLSLRHNVDVVAPTCNNKK